MKNHLNNTKYFEKHLVLSVKRKPKQCPYNIIQILLVLKNNKKYMKKYTEIYDDSKLFISLYY